MAAVARPPTDRDRLRVRRVAADEVGRRGLDQSAGEEVDGQVEAAPPGVDLAPASSIGRGDARQAERRLGGRREVATDLTGVVRAVFGILVERGVPGDFLWCGVDVHLTGEM